MVPYPFRPYSSHGSGAFQRADLGRCGQNVIIEAGVRIFHPERVFLEDNLYIGHGTLLKGYYKNDLILRQDCWVGQGCFFHSAGGIEVGAGTGIGPGVRILTSTHEETGPEHPIMAGALQLAPVFIGEGSDIGVGAIILPGVRIGRGVQVGAGAVVTADLPDHCIAAGIPARVLRFRGQPPSSAAP